MRILHIFIFLLVYIYSFAQSVPSVISATPRVERTTVPYDSLKNICKSNCKQLVGQEIYFLPNSGCERDGDYNLDILTSYPTGTSILSINRDGSNVYQPYQTSYGATKTSYAGLVKKKFRIIDYIEIPQSFGKPVPYLVLENPINNEPLYFECSYFNEGKTPYIILGYFEKMRQNYINHKYLPIDGITSLTRMSDMQIVNSNLPDTLTCIDLTILDKQWSPMAIILRGSDNEQYFAELSDYRLRPHLMDVAQHEEAQRARRDAAAEHERQMIAKYGRTNGRIIAQGKVKIGFTKQMCIDAWGEPKDVNTTTTRYGKREQWVYYDSYLYFENGKLTSIQN